MHNSSALRSQTSRRYLRSSRLVGAKILPNSSARSASSFSLRSKLIVTLHHSKHRMDTPVYAKAQGTTAKDVAQLYTRWNLEREARRHAESEARKQKEIETVQQAQAITDLAVNEIMADESSRTRLFGDTFRSEDHRTGIVIRRTSPAECEVLTRMAVSISYPLDDDGKKSIRAHSARKIKGGCEFTISTEVRDYGGWWD